MKYFITLFLLGIGFATYTFAQITEYSGFYVAVDEDENDEQKIEEEQIKEEVKTEIVVKENINQATEEKKIEKKVHSSNQIRTKDFSPNSSQKVEKKISEEVSVEDEEDESDEEKEEQERRIYIALDDISSTLASIRSVSYCSGTLILFNDTKKDIQEISGTISIGNQKKNFKFKNIASGSSGGQSLQVVGNACESIFSTRLSDFDFQTCKVKEMSRSRCLGKLWFVPIEKK